jgi:hypothetical protein
VLKTICCNSHSDTMTKYKHCDIDGLFNSD